MAKPEQAFEALFYTIARSMRYKYIQPIANKTLKLGILLRHELPGCISLDLVLLLHILQRIEYCRHL